MYRSTAIRLFLLFGLLALVGFGVAAFSAPDRPAGVLLGTVGAFLAALAVIAECERRTEPADPWQVTR